MDRWDGACETYLHCHNVFVSFDHMSKWGDMHRMRDRRCFIRDGPHDDVVDDAYLLEEGARLSAIVPLAWPKMPRLHGRVWVTGRYGVLSQRIQWRNSLFA